MQSEKISYVHRPVIGLPKSLVQPEGQTISAIALMSRQGGMNRKVRRDKKPSSSPVYLRAQLLAKKIFLKDWKVLATYVSPDERWTSFWKCILHKQVNGSLLC